MERKYVRGKNDNKDLNIRLATWMMEHPYNDTTTKGGVCGGETRKMWLTRMSKENNVSQKNYSVMAAKVQFLKRKYLAAKKWSETLGQKMLNNEGLSTFMDVLLKMCPWFYVMNGEIPVISVSQPNSSFHSHSGGSSVNENENDVISEHSTGSIKYLFMKEDGLVIENEDVDLEESCSTPSEINSPASCEVMIESRHNIETRKREGIIHKRTMLENNSRVLEKISLKEKEIACQLKRDELKYEYKRRKLAFKETNERERRIHEKGCQIHEKEMAKIEIQKLALQIQLKKMENGQT